MTRMLLFAIFGLFLTPTLTAQQGWEAGAWGGVSHYFGDLNTSFRLNQLGLAGGAAARYNFNNRISLRFGAAYGHVAGDDALSNNLFERARNLNFESDLGDFTTQLEFNFLPYIHGSKDQFFTPYLLAGFTVFYFNPTTEYQGDIYELRNLGTEGQFKGEEYTSVNAALAYGIGLKIDLSYRWSINLELSGRRLFTDYLDDVSTVYADPDDIEQLRGEVAAALSDRSIEIPGVNSQEIGEPGRQRGNSIDNDSYALL
ncbi:MAG: outer membrane beta-barrel protein, partial [Phaeodactylibacter sp.]|nr:outer membrane beta-barrel protein [Phaeodactylibacter sp.]